jgi:hypothetical protein
MICAGRFAGKMFITLVCFGDVRAEKFKGTLTKGFLERR